jgi:hypothetical protein
MPPPPPPPAGPGDQPPYVPGPPPTRKDMKAQARAAAAYAKSQRPWYKKKRFLLPIAVLVLIVIIAVAANSRGSDNGSTASPGGDTSNSTSPQPSESASAPNTTGATADLPIQNGDWRLDSIRVSNDGLGDFGGSARVTYTGTDTGGGANLFTVTVFVHGKDVAALQGSANTVQPGDAVTVQLISTDKFVKGPYKYDFQNDL